MPIGSIWKNFLHVPVRGVFRGVASPRHDPGNDVMHRSHQWLLACSLLASHSAIAQDMLSESVFRQDELLGADRPEAWAMNYFAASSLMTAFGETPALRPGQWQAAIELGQIPRLSEEQQLVGFDAVKREDLNKSPVFGRLRVTLGLPAGWIAELGYTPPLTIDGVHPQDLIAIAIGHRLIERGAYTLSARAFGQHGGAQGDITCPAELAGVEDSERNPYGCQAASDDHVTLNYYGVDLVSGWNDGPWHWHADVGVARTETEVRVDALTFDFRDRSRLVARDVLPFVAVGAGRDIGAHWRVGVELLHVPLTVRRGPDAPRDSDPLTSLRLQVRYQAD
jgi:hypothetical protein